MTQWLCLFQVSVDEWCNMWDAYAKDPSSVMDWQNAYMNFMFDLEDALSSQPAYVSVLP